MKFTWQLFSPLFLYSFIPFSFVLLSLSAQSINYYISNSGNDANNGTSPSSAWRTIDKVNQMMGSFLPGDSILFQRGGRFRGEIDFTASGNTAQQIYIGAYGAGNLPVIEGSEILSGWTFYSGNIWKAGCAACSGDIANLLLNKNIQPWGRFPNKGYLPISGASGKTEIYDNSQNYTNGYWNGGEAVVRTNHWVLDRLQIQSSGGNTLTFSDSASYDFTAGFGYFIQKHYNTLDTTGEWYFDRTNKIVYFYYPGFNASADTVEISFYDYGIKMLDVNYVTVENISFANQMRSGDTLQNCRNIIFRNNKVLYGGINGISAVNCDTMTLENNIIENSNNDGILLRDSRNIAVVDNTIKKSGAIAGRGLGGTDGGNYIGIEINGWGNENTLLQYNNIDSSGYIGACIFFGNNARVLNNYVTNTAFVKDDAGGIYTGLQPSSCGNQIIGNIVMYSIGAPDGTPHDTYPLTSGIYLDDCSDSVIVKDNTAAFSDLGIFVHNSKNCVIKDNTFFNNRQAQLYMKRDNPLLPACPISNSLIKHNIYFSMNQWERCVDLESLNYDVNSFGIFDSNHVCNPFTSLVVKRVLNLFLANEETQQLTIDDWEGGNIHQATNSFSCPKTWDTFIVSDTLSANMISNSDFTGDIIGWTSWSPFSSGNISWDTVTQINGPTLKADFIWQNNSYQQVIYPGFPVDSGSVYLASFSIKGTKPYSFQHMACEDQSPWSPVGASAEYAVNSQVHDYKHFLFAGQSFPSARMIFYIPDNDSVCWIDDVRLYKIDGNCVDFDTLIYFYYNPTKNWQNIPLTGVFRNVDSVEVFGNYALPPYSSVILLRDTFALHPGINEYEEKTKNNIIVYPNPLLAGTPLYIELTDGSKENISTDIFNSLGECVFSMQDNNKRKISITDTNFKPGIYFIKVSSKNKIFLKKLVVL